MSLADEGGYSTPSSISLLISGWHFSPRWTILECWSTANLQWGNTCNEYAERLFTSFASSASYEVPYRWRHVQPWFTHSSQVGLTTVTAYFPESTKNCWTGSNQFFGPQLAWSWENENSIRFPKISGTLYTGSPKNRIQTRYPRLQMSSRRCPILFDRVAVEGSGHSGSPSPQVCHPRWPTLWCLELEQLKWARGVFVSRVQCFGKLLFRSKFDTTNKLWSRSRQN